ncbi:MAG: prepilin-type N-terminal cleavage/methylation domain-containing protein [Deltaproteobacteria bacterium]|nr:prepilin-type N-terminal cleavage/methylation domain-containing protein [Deltaproteobacteria bacterium]
MPTSIAERSIDDRPRRRAAGFTLIEVALVLLIISIVLALTIPRLRSVSRAELGAQARRLTNTFRFLRSEAILTGQICQLRYDLNRERYWVTVSDPGGESSAPLRAGGPLARGVSLESPVGISDIVLPESVGKVQEGQWLTNFYPDGTIDLTVIHIDNGTDAFTLWVNPLTGRLFLSPGYQEVDYGA